MIFISKKTKRDYLQLLIEAEDNSFASQLKDIDNKSYLEKKLSTGVTFNIFFLIKMQKTCF